jgi:glycosyltransferase involved in cell wall biosynthesis
MKMCSAFAAQGAEVELVVPRGHDRAGSGDIDPYRYYAVGNHFPIVQLARLPLLKRSYAFAAKIFLALRSGRFRPDLVYSRDLLAGFAALLAGARLVLEIHHPMRESGRLHGRLFDWIVRHRRFVRLVVITHALKDWHCRHAGMPPEMILVAPDGADSREHTGHAECPVNIAQNDRFRVAYVGSLYAGKGIEVVVPLARRLPEMDFHVLGGSGECLQQWQERAGGQGNLIFHGHCPPAQVHAFLRAMDVLLLPNQQTVRSAGGSEIGRWTSPLKLFEYMATGKPIVASDLTVLREVLVHEQNCLLCAPDDIDAWQQALLRLQTDRRLAGEIAANAYAELHAIYTWETRAAALLKVLAVGT